MASSPILLEVGDELLVLPLQQTWTIVKCDVPRFWALSTDGCIHEFAFTTDGKSIVVDSKLYEWDWAAKVRLQEWISTAGNFNDDTVDEMIRSGEIDRLDKDMKASVRCQLRNSPDCRGMNKDQVEQLVNHHMTHSQIQTMFNVF
jgi:hypothetical protein